MNTKTLLFVKNLSIFAKNKQIIKNISFEIKQGEVFALVGESGSGKSLTALAIVDLLANNLYKTGDIFYKNKNLNNNKNFRGNEIAFIFQDPANCLNPVLTIGEQVDEVLALHTSLNKSERQKKILQTFKKVALEDSDQMLGRYPHQISGGQKQRVMIAFALLSEAKLLIADEPTTALDVTTQKAILELLLKLKKEQKLSILLITHDLSVVKMMADKVGVMFNGKIIENENKDVFFKNPKKEYSKNLLVSLPKNNREQNFYKVLLKGKNIKVYFPIKTGIFKRTTAYTKAVENINFELKQGQNLAIVGESGSGKTTLAKAIMRQLKVFSGNIVLDGNKVDDYKRKNYATKVQIVFQNVYSSFNPRMTVLQALLEVLNALNPSKANINDINLLLKEVELEPELMHRYPHELSGGQLQRLSIARAISSNPKIIICDEPTSALDVTIKVQILELLLRLQKQKNISYIMITHDMSIVDYFADEILVIKNGKVLEGGLVSDVLNSPKNDYTKELLSSVL